jgi:hypothetical protein
MNPLALIPYALAAYGGYKGYKGAKDAGASGIGRLLGAAGGAYSGYTLGSTGMSMFPGSAATQSFVASQPAFLRSMPGAYNPARMPTSYPGMNKSGEAIFASDMNAARALQNNQSTGGNLLDILKRQKEGGKPGELEYSPGKVSAAIAAATYGLGAFDQQPTDIYTPGYNMGYLDLQAQRPGYTYIDPTTGEEKAYEKVYAPEQAGLGDPRMGSYSMNVRRLRVGGIAEIKKFNEGGINYLPSKVSHDENDANNYVRASGYVEDGAGVGDKDEDTMLAQLADGEFVTRADGVLGAGIIAGANPNSMKDMREKGAQYFYEQQKRYKRVFDLLQDRNGDSKQKTN